MRGGGSDDEQSSQQKPGRFPGDPIGALPQLWPPFTPSITAAGGGVPCPFFKALLSPPPPPPHKTPPLCGCT